MPAGLYWLGFTPHMKLGKPGASLSKRQRKETVKDNKVGIGGAERMPPQRLQGMSSNTISPGRLASVEAAVSFSGI